MIRRSQTLIGDRWKYVSGALSGKIIVAFGTLFFAGLFSANATPVFHGISAANVTVTQKSTSTSSASAAALTNALSINNFIVAPLDKRGLYPVQIGSTTSNNVQNGVLITSIIQNGRNNNEGAASAFPGITYGASAGTGSAGGISTSTTYTTNSLVVTNANSTLSTNYTIATNTVTITNLPGATGQWSVYTYGNAEPVTATNYTYSTNITTGVITTNVAYTRDSGSYAWTSFNINFSAAYFPYNQGFYGGWIVNTLGVNNDVVADTTQDTFIGNTNLVLGVNVVPGTSDFVASSASVTVDLRQFGLNASNAVMIAGGGKAEENYAASKPNVDGTWTVTCRDDQTGSAEADPVAFVAIPLANTNVITGRFAANLNALNHSAPVEMANAPVAATWISTGTYHLVIPGVNPNRGVLIISDDEDGAHNPDNAVSCQATNDGWIIQTRDLGPDQTPNLQNFSGTSNPLNPLISDTVINFVFIPAPTTGIEATPTNGLVTTESGNSAAFTVSMDAAPTAEVDLSLSVSDPTAGALSVNSLFFNATNWNIPQTVTVTGLNNSATSPENYTVRFQPAVSADTNYSGFQTPSVAVVNIPTGTPGVYLVPTTGLTTAGAGSTATFQAILGTAPSANVVVNFTSGNMAQGTVSPAAITFNSGNWSAPQTITVSGADDGIVEGNVAYQISSAVSSSDPNYSGYNAGSVNVINQETDVAGVNTSVTNITVLEGGTVNFTAVLSAQPVSNVTITYTSSDTTAGTVSPTSLTFTPANWNQPQIVTLTGIANPARTSNESYLINAVVSSSNYGYSNLTLQSIAAVTANPISWPAGTTVYGLGMPPVGIDGQATASDAINFSGASLVFTLTTNADPADILNVRSDQTGVGIMVSGNTISYGGNAIATFSGGTNAPLAITINNGVIGDTVALLLQAVTFCTTSTNNFANRAVQLSLNNGTSMVTKSIRVGQLRVTHYQNNVDWGYGAYNGETNNEIAQTNSSLAFPSGSSTINGLYVKCDSGFANEHQVLLGFYNLVGTNIGQIPPGSTIVSADISVNVLHATGDGWAFNRMLVPWDETYTWGSFQTDFGVYIDVPANNPDADVEVDSQMGNYVMATNATTGQVTDSTAGVKVGVDNVSVTPDIQAWVNGQTNYGWVLNATPPSWGAAYDLTSGTGFSPGQDPNVTLHPQLRVYWLPPGIASASFQNGTNNYTAAYDADITQATPDQNNVSAVTIWSDGADAGEFDTTEVLMRFDNIIGSATNQIPPGAHIEVAMLNLSCLNSSDCNGNGGQFYALYQPWQDTSVTWNSWNANTNGILNDGIEAAINPTATAGTYTSSVDNFVPGGFHSFEVTADVQNWANGALANNGWGIVPWYNAEDGWGSDGWGINSSKDPNVSTHPQLVVYYTMPAGYVAPPSRLALNVTQSQVLVHFAGSANITYTVWRTDSLKDAWTNIGTVTTDSNGTAIFTDLAPLSTAGFYRISH